jgi:hypothetical protein
MATVSKEVTAAQLAAIVQPVTRSQPVSIVYEGAHRFSRTVKGTKVLTTVTRVINAWLNHDYTKKVRNITGDTTFQSEELRGKTRLSSTVIRSDKSGELLLDYKVLNVNDPEQRTQFFTLSLKHNGVEISIEEAEKNDLFQPAYYAPKDETQTSGRGTVEFEDDFQMFTLSFNKIQKLVMGGVEYTVVPEDEADGVDYDNLVREQEDADAWANSL